MFLCEMARAGLNCGQLDACFLLDRQRRATVLGLGGGDRDHRAGRDSLLSLLGKEKLGRRCQGPEVLWVR
jgi:hypothetical protein